jgi:hypothetical protein
MAEAIGAKAIRVMAHTRRETCRSQISIGGTIANAIAIHVPVKAEPTKVTHDNHVRPRHILRQE